MQKAQTTTGQPMPATDAAGRWIVLLKIPADPNAGPRSSNYKRVELTATTAAAAVSGCEDLPGELVDVQPATADGRRAIERHLPGYI